MAFYIGQLRPFRWSEVKHITSSQDMKDFKFTQGDILETFGHLCEWDEDCVPVSLCESWRSIGDPVCDAALREVFPYPSATVGKDLLQSLVEHVANRPGEFPAAEAFLNEVHQAPPPELSATEQEVTIAQELFIDDSVQILQALLHYSLAGGLASSRIVRTLEAVSYILPHIQKAGDGSCLSSLDDVVLRISPESRDRTFVRLLETMQFVLDVMGCSAPPTPSSPSTSTKDTGAKGSDDVPSNRLDDLLPGGEGWKSSVRVRLLHGVARWRVQNRWEREKIPEDIDSVPISQEEAAATLAAFSTIPIWCLRRLHLPPTLEQTSAYLALWRHVGYYMGVSPSILNRYFTTTNAADKFIATAALNLFWEEPSSASSSSSSAPASTLLRGPTIPILVAVSHRPPLNTSLEYSIALTTHLLGRPLATHLGLPEMSLATRLRMHAFLFVQRIPHHFARWYPRKAWLEKRRAVLREGMVRTVLWRMGMRRTTFRPRTMAKANEGDKEKDGEEAGEAGGELAPGVVEAEGVQPNPARARMLTRQWKEVLYEMVGVSIAVCVLAGTLWYVGIRYACVFVPTLYS